MVHTSEHANKQINEKGPYLLQRAYNPVNWYPWNEEAFEVAKRENRPISLKFWIFLLSLMAILLRCPIRLST